MKTLYITLFLLLFTASAYAQTASITGVVQDNSTHAALSGVSVSLPGKTTTSDSSGHYTLSALSAGTYSVSLSKAGYTSQTLSVSVATGSSRVDMGTVGLVWAVEPIGFQATSDSKGGFGGAGGFLFGFFIYYGLEFETTYLSTKKRRKR